MDTTYSRRQLMGMGLGSLASLSLLGLAGCETSAPSSTGQGPASLGMIFWGSAARNKLTQQAIGLFQKSHPGVTIDSQIFGYNNYYVKLNAGIASGHAPDLIQMDMRYIAQYVREGALLDLTPFIYNQSIDLSDFDPILLDSSKVNNTIYGIPLGSNYFCLYCDRTQIDKSGLGPLPPHASWETFAEYATELTKALGHGIYGVADSSGNYDLFEIWIRQRGTELYTRDGALNFALADVVDWYTYWDNLRKADGCVPANLQAKLDLTGTPTDSSVVKGKAVFSHLFTNQYEAYQVGSPHPLEMIQLPRGKSPGVYLKVSMLLSISASTKYQDDAASFTSFLTVDPQGVRALGIERGVPGSAEALNVLKPQLPPAEQVITAFMNEVANSGTTRVKEVLDPPAAGQIATVLTNVSLDIGSGKSSVADGAKAFYAAAQKATAQ